MKYFHWFSGVMKYINGALNKLKIDYFSFAKQHAPFYPETTTAGMDNSQQG